MATTTTMVAPPCRSRPIPRQRQRSRPRQRRCGRKRDITAGTCPPRTSMLVFLLVSVVVSMMMIRNVTSFAGASSATTLQRVGRERRHYPMAPVTSTTATSTSTATATATTPWRRRRRRHNKSSSRSYQSQRALQLPLPLPLQLNLHARWREDESVLSMPRKIAMAVPIQTTTTKALRQRTNERLTRRPSLASSKRISSSSSSSSVVWMALRSGASDNNDGDTSDNNDSDGDSEETPTPVGGPPDSNKSNHRSIVATAALTALAADIVAAKVGLLPGPPLMVNDVATAAFKSGGGGGGMSMSSMSSSLFQQHLISHFDYSNNYAPYTDALIARDVGATILTAVLGYAFVQTVTWAATATTNTNTATDTDTDTGTATDTDTSDTKKLPLLPPSDARKIIHTLSAPLFILFWPVFSDAAGARFFAAVVPLINGLRLSNAAGSGNTGSTGNTGSGTSGSEAALAAAVSRSGNAKEAGEGPFIYVCVLAACVLLFWKDVQAPAGIVALSNLAAGDGLADLVGRRYGKNNKWPGIFSDKSVAGTMAFWVGATACSVGLLLWTQSFAAVGGTFVLQTKGLELVATVAAISGVTALLELLPWADDNYTVPVAAGVLTMLFLH